MPRVELIYDGDCPNVAETRARLLRAFARQQMEARWREWRADEEDSPTHVRGYGSPTVLVDGRDVVASKKAAAACCRMYAQADGSIGGAPDVETIAAALARAGARADVTPASSPTDETTGS